MEWCDITMFNHNIIYILKCIGWNRRVHMFDSGKQNLIFGTYLFKAVASESSQHNTIVYILEVYNNVGRFKEIVIVCVNYFFY